MPEASYPFPEPEIALRGPLHLAGLSVRVTMEDMAPIGALWMRFDCRVPGQVAPDAYGVSHSGDGRAFTYLAAVAAGDPAAVPEAFDRFEFARQECAVFRHESGTTRLRETLEAIYRRWLPASGRQAAAGAPCIEHYGAAFDPATGTGRIDIWLPLAAG
jgi:AraC family transcriptional regulator